MIELPEWAQWVQVWVGLFQPIFVPLGVIGAGGLAAWVATSGRRQEARDTEAERLSAAVAEWIEVQSSILHAVASVTRHKIYRDAAESGKIEHFNLADWRKQDDELNRSVMDASRPDEHASFALLLRVSDLTQARAVRYKSAVEALGRKIEEVGFADLPFRFKAEHEQARAAFKEIAIDEARATRKGKRAIKRFEQRYATERPQSEDRGSSGSI